MFPELGRNCKKCPNYCLAHVCGEYLFRGIWSRWAAWVGEVSDFGFHTRATAIDRIAPDYAVGSKTVAAKGHTAPCQRPSSSLTSLPSFSRIHAS